VDPKTILTFVETRRQGSSRPAFPSLKYLQTVGLFGDWVEEDVMSCKEFGEASKLNLWIESCGTPRRDVASPLFGYYQGI
jgi:hypothetical protein